MLRWTGAGCPSASRPSAASGRKATTTSTRPPTPDGQEDVRLAELALPDPHAQARDHRDTPARRQVVVKQPVESEENGLVRERRHRQLLHAAVGELDQAVATVRQRKVLLVAPRALGGRQGTCPGRPDLPQQGVQIVLRGGGRVRRNTGGTHANILPHPPDVSDARLSRGRTRAAPGRSRAPRKSDRGSGQRPDFGPPNRAVTPTSRAATFERPRRWSRGSIQRPARSRTAAGLALRRT